MILKQLKIKIIKLPKIAYLSLLALLIVEIWLWSVGRLYPINHEVYLTLLSPVSISAGSLPLFCISLALILKRFNLLEKIRISTVLRTKTNLTIITMISIIVSLIPSVIFLTLALASHNSSLIVPQVMGEIIIRHFMLLFSIGLIQYIGTFFIKNKYIVPAITLTTFLFLSFMTQYQGVKYIFIFINPPIKNQGFALINIIPLFLGLMLILISSCFIISQKKEALGE